MKPILLALAAVGAATAVWLALPAGRTVGKPSQPREPADEPETRANAAELDDMRAAIARLSRRSAALELAVAELARAVPAPAPVVETPSHTEDPPNAPNPDTDGPMFRQLDAALQADRGDSRDRSAAASAVRSELSAAASGYRVVGVECGTAFCKATLERDNTASATAEIEETGKLIDAAPFLRQQAVFAYENSESVKRTTIYAARVGKELPLPGP